MTDLIISRNDDAKASFSLMEDMFVERGTTEDWHKLHELHYKAENLGLGPHFYRLDLYGETIGVLVTTAPRLLLRERHKLMPNMKPGGDSKLSNTTRAMIVNRDFRIISRFVIDTQFRGIGAGYRMMNIVARMEGTRYCEISSSMSKFNLFGQKAGFRFVKPDNSNYWEKGIKFFKSNFRSEPADHAALIAEIESKPEKLRERLIEECRRFYFRHSALEKTGSNRENGRRKVDEMALGELIRQIQQLTLASPLYGLYENPDANRRLPQQIPLLAFDRQAPQAPLVEGDPRTEGEKR